MTCVCVPKVPKVDTQTQGVKVLILVDENWKNLREKDGQKYDNGENDGQQICSHGPGTFRFV